MKRKGVLYDVGRYSGVNWRPDYHPRAVRRELQIIAEDLHCTAVKICARDINRLLFASEVALELGMEVWFCPELWGRAPEATLAHIVRAAHAGERLRQRWPESVVFSVGTELSVFMRGIVPGRTVDRRVRSARAKLRAGWTNAQLDAFLARAVGAVRGIFGGPLTYASLPFERVDWTLFDIVGVDHYWYRHIADRYADTLQPWLAVGKPLVISEFGFRTRTGADLTGPAGPENINVSSMLPWCVPGLRSAARPRVKNIHERNETLQADSLVRQLAVLDELGVDGAFVYTFVAPMFVHGADPRHDLDTDSFALTKTLPGGHHGTTYPDMTWEPKQSFIAVADYYAAR